VLASTDALGQSVSYERTYIQDQYGKPIQDRGDIVSVTMPDPDDFSQRAGDVVHTNGTLGPLTSVFDYDSNGNIIKQFMPSLGSAPALTTTLGNYEFGRPQISVNELGHIVDSTIGAATADIGKRGNVTEVKYLAPDAIPTTGLGAAQWQSPYGAYDVNISGEISPIDVLLVINDLNAAGPRKLPARSPSESTSFIDVNGDGFVTPIDALHIINHLNDPNSVAPSGVSRPSNVQLEYAYTGPDDAITVKGLIKSETVHTGRDADHNGVLDKLLTLYDYYDGGAPENDGASVVLKAARYGLLESVTSSYDDGTVALATIRYEYDRFGNLATVTDELGRKSYFAFDALNRLVQVTDTDPDDGAQVNNGIDEYAPIVQYQYDSFGNMISLTEQNYIPSDVVTTVQTTCFFYDPANRLQWLVEPDPDKNTTIDSCTILLKPQFLP
jgi:YD repeat-containing protein